MTRVRELQIAGVSIWLDTLSRELIESGGLATLIDDFAVTGATSNPSIFAKAIVGSHSYDHDIRAASGAGIHDTQEVFFELALEDVRRAADLLRLSYDATGGRDGFVSFECTPDLADDTAGTIEQAMTLWSRLDRPNVMIKVPATEAGIPAIEELTARGINVNVTLLFSVARYEQVIDAYMSGLERRVEAGEPVDTITSVASFFVSRVDTKADALLPAESDLRGRVAIANAALAYGVHRKRLAEPRWLALRDAGARPQRPLWASTGTKDPAYSDVVYVERLIGDGVVNTMPEATLRAFADHGQVSDTLAGSGDAARATLEGAAAAGVDLDAITRELEREGVESFCDAYHELLDCIATTLRPVRRLLFVADAAVADVAELPPPVRSLIDTAGEVFVLTPTLPGRLAWLADQVDGYRHLADERLDAVLGHMRSVGAQATGAAGRGSVMTVIADAVARNRPDHILIALRSSEHANWQEHRLVERIEEAFAVPLTMYAVDPDGYTAHAGGPALLCYDGSASAREAIERAASLLGGGQALVLTVWQPTVGLGSFAWSGATASMVNFVELDRAAAEDGTRIAEQGAALARRAGFSAQPLAVKVTGSVWKTIIDIADREDASTIVMGSRGLTGLRSASLGSVSAGLVHNAERPTLVIGQPVVDS
jgi:transaldolase